MNTIIILAMILIVYILLAELYINLKQRYTDWRKTWI